MYTVMAYSPKDIFVAYLVVIASCALLYPIARIIYTAIERGVSRWR
ncbi:hypothetical protein [Cytobacillus sp.]|nr:hypothetical protein [Cytobacillus sp.]